MCRPVYGYTKGVYYPVLEEVTMATQTISYTVLAPLIHQSTDALLGWQFPLLLCSYPKTPFLLCSYSVLSVNGNTVYNGKGGVSQPSSTATGKQNVREYVIFPAPDVPTLKATETYRRQDSTFLTPGQPCEAYGHLVAAQDNA